MRPVLCERFSGTIDFGDETNYREATSVPKPDIRAVRAERLLPPKVAFRQVRFGLGATVRSDL